MNRIRRGIDWLTRPSVSWLYWLGALVVGSMRDPFSSWWENNLLWFGTFVAFAVANDLLRWAAGLHKRKNGKTTA